MNKPLAATLILALTNSFSVTCRAAEGDEKAPEEKATGTAVAGAPMKSASFDCEAWELGVPPK
jgi:hypothetical protein